MTGCNELILFFAVRSLSMPVFLATGYAVLCLWFILRHRFFRIKDVPPWHMAGFFVVKVLTGFLLAWIYTHWYTDRVAADTFKYFDDSEKIFPLWTTDRKLFFEFLLGTSHYSPEYLEFSNTLNTWWNKYAIYNDGRTMVRINTLLRFISMGYYPVHSILFCFITFCGLTAFCHALLPWLNKYRKVLIYLLFLFPSLTFWSSGLMKDGIILAGTGGTLLMMSLYLQKKIQRVRFWAGLLFFLLLTFFSKLHIFFVLIPCLTAMLFYRQKNQQPWLPYLLAVIFCGSLVVVLPVFIPSADLLAFMADKQAENIRMAVTVKAGSYFEIPRLDGTILNFIACLPTGLFNALLRPLPHEINSPLMLLATTENMIIAISLVVVVVKNFPSIAQQPALFWFSVSFVLILLSVIGMMTPVSGAIVRYKIQALPFLFFVLLRMMENRARD
jgi:hypothetical protein